MPLRGHLLGQALAQAEQAGLGRGVVGLADAAGLPDHRADVDDPAELALEHVVEDGLDHVERAREVDPQHRVPVLDGHLAHRLVHGDAGVVDQVVDPPALFEHLVDDPVAVGGLADVALVHRHRPAPGAELAGELVGAWELLLYPAATCTPERASAVVMAAPMPRAPPVTIATR